MQAGIVALQHDDGNWAPGAVTGQPVGKVLILATMTSPSGAPIAALRLAAGLATAGWAVRAAFLYDRVAMNQVDFAATALLARPPRGPLDHMRIVVALSRLIRAERPDAIFGFLPLASVLGAAIGRLHGVPVRIVSHRVPRSTYGGAMRLLDLMAAWSGCYTDVVAVSRSVGDSCRSYPAWLRARIVVVYNGLRDWQPSPLGKAAARARFAIPDDALVIVAVGRLERQKNYPLLIEAMAATGPGCVLAVAGEGSLHDALIADVAARGLTGRVRLLGALPRGDVPVLLAAADLFAQPSLFEGQSNALLEALHAGLPCLVGEVAEQIETVRGADGGVAGAILPLDRPAAWAAAISHYATDPVALEQARACSARQAGLFTFARMMGGFEAVLRDAVARVRRR